MHSACDACCEAQIPLAARLPFSRLPWLFTYNSWSLQYDYMLKAAVRSAALKAPLLQPICIFAGEPKNAQLYSWLIRQGVRIIHHDPIWKDAFAEKLRGKDNVKHSHLYATADMQVKSNAHVQGTWGLLTLSGSLCFPLLIMSKQ